MREGVDVIVMEAVRECVGVTEDDRDSVGVTEGVQLCEAEGGGVVEADGVTEEVRLGTWSQSLGTLPLARCRTACTWSLASSHHSRRVLGAGAGVNVIP